MLPPASVPRCSGPNPAAAAAPAPDDDPPVEYRVSQGFRVIPCSGQSPGDFHPNSVVVVLPRMTAPAAFSPSTAGPSAAAGSAGVVRLPRRVGNPAMSTRSFTVHGTPSSTPIGRPARHRPSLSRAAASARGSSTANAFSAGLCRAIRSVTACSTSTGLSVPRARYVPQQRLCRGSAWQAPSAIRRPARCGAAPASPSPHPARHPCWAGTA